MTAARRTPTPKSSSSGSNVLFGLAVVAVVAGGAFLFLRPSEPDPGPVATTEPTAEVAQAVPAVSTPEEFGTYAAKPGHPADVPLPELPLGNFSPARPVEQTRDAFLFAAEHPEVLQYVPCFCGCQSLGHVGNDTCFVSARDNDGRVLAWEPHGVSCAVCIDVATDAMRMYASGASITQIRTAVENKWRPLASTMTPTPHPEHAE